jgi:hypothetical protein
MVENYKLTSVINTEDSDDDKPTKPNSRKAFQNSNISYDGGSEQISETTRALRMPVTNKREEVLRYRKGKDIYTQKKESEIENPHVDHIIEDQIMAHAMHGVLRQQVVVSFIEPMKEVLNQNENYNVTSSTINQSKGACIKSFFNDGRHKGEPLRVIVLDLACERYINRICSAMDDSHGKLDPDIRASRLENGRVNGNSEFDRIAEQMADILYAKLNIRNDDDGRKTRSKNKK